MPLENTLPVDSMQSIVQRSVYVNDNDRNATHWLSKLPFEFDCIDDRSIVEVQANDVIGYTQCHFFAGIGGWPLALEIAGWPTDACVWTGSCPCQPFSAAGKRKGVEDSRHLWPEFRRLVNECRPATIFGEQVASKDGRDWLATVRTDLEALGYAVGAADLCAAGVGAPHIRQRLYWVAHSASASGPEHEREQGRRPRRKSGPENITVDRRDSSWLANGGGSRLEERQEQSTRQELATVERSGDVGRMANSGCERSDPRSGSRRRLDAGERSESSINDQPDGGMGNAQSGGSDRGIRCESSESRRDGSGVFERPGHWDDVEFIPCIDGKARPVKPGVCLLANGIPGRVAQLRGLGNAIVPQVAATFIAAFLDSIR